MSDFETLLREAFAPVDPPAELEARLEERLTTLVEAAVDELEGWELATMRDPRNWGPTIAAAGVGGAAAVGLVLVRVQRRPAGGRPPHQSPALQRYVAQLQAYIESNGGIFMDDTGDPAHTLQLLEVELKAQREE